MASRPPTSASSRRGRLAHLHPHPIPKPGPSTPARLVPRPHFLRGDETPYPHASPPPPSHPHTLNPPSPKPKPKPGPNPTPSPNPNQVKTTCDFYAPFWQGLHCAGLGYQIEHHLFPTVSICHFPQVSKIVMQACADFGLPYHYYNSWGHAVVAHYEYLKEMGRR